MEDSDLIPLTDSTDLVGDVDALQARFGEDGYVFVRGVVPQEALLEVRRAITRVCGRHRWFVEDSDPMDAIPRIEPRVEGEQPFFRAYDDIQRLEVFHALAHHPSVLGVMRLLLDDSAFPHPLSIARLAFPDNDEWATPPHQDYPNNQGTQDLYACWIPLGHCPVALGPLSVLCGSHRIGLAPLTYALGAGHRRAVLDERFDGLEWHGGDLHAGDLIVFHSLTVHRALPNVTDRMRLSVDYRYQREGEPLTAGCLEPHFGRLSWDEIYAGWRRTDLQYYWRNKRFEIVEWDRELHDLTDEENDAGLRMWLRWRARHPRRDNPNPDAYWRPRAS